jgi:co-chaperonin GroES (HSP10)
MELECKEQNFDELVVANDIVPMGERIVVKQKEVVQAGRIFIPKTSKQMESTEGLVIAVGDETQWLVPNLTVYYGRYAGVVIPKRGSDVEFTMMNERDVIGIINDDKYKAYIKKREEEKEQKKLKEEGEQDGSKDRTES